MSTIKKTRNNKAYIEEEEDSIIRKIGEIRYKGEGEGRGDGRTLAKGVDLLRKI